MRKKLNERIIRGAGREQKNARTRKQSECLESCRAHLLLTKDIKFKCTHSKEPPHISTTCPAECYQSMMAFYSISPQNHRSLSLPVWPNRIEFNVKQFQLCFRPFAPLGEAYWHFLMVYKEIPLEKDHENTLNFLLFNSQTNNIKTDFIW